MDRGHNNARVHGVLEDIHACMHACTDESLNMFGLVTLEWARMLYAEFILHNQNKTTCIRGK